MDSNSDKSEGKVEEGGLQKKELPPSMQKICLICGDKALGYNFNAISCESCKAFFRRNALASKELKCPFNNHCEITVVTRRFCQRCRLEKCLAVGMVKEFIMSDEDKAEKRRKIQENRAKKRQGTEPDDGVSSSKSVRQDPEATMTNFAPTESNIVQYDVLSTTCSPNSTMQSPVSNEIDSSVHSPPVYSQYTEYTPVHSTEAYTMKLYPIDEKTIINSSLYEHRMQDQYGASDRLDSNQYADGPKQNSIQSLLVGEASQPVESKHVCQELPAVPSDDPDVNKARDILQDVERIEPHSMESIMCEAIKLEFEAFSSVGRCPTSSRELNEVERAKLAELVAANRALHAPIDDDVTQLVGAECADGIQERSPGHDPRLVTIVNLTAVAIRRLIKMAKRIGGFRNMCQEDQIALLKGGCIEMMVLRSTMAYDGQRDQWKLPHSQEQFGSVGTDVLKLASRRLYRSHAAFIRSFPAAWRADEPLVLLLCAVLLFSPHRARLVHRDVVRLEQNSYYYLLRRYLESQRGGCEARDTFLRLLQRLASLRPLAGEVTGVYLDVNPIEPLLMEIFDLKHHAA